MVRVTQQRKSNTMFKTVTLACALAMLASSAQASLLTDAAAAFRSAPEQVRTMIYANVCKYDDSYYALALRGENKKVYLDVIGKIDAYFTGPGAGMTLQPKFCAAVK
jgi:hypothetical protein